MWISMATRSVLEHPGRFLVAILGSLIYKLHSHAGLPVRPRLYIYVTISQEGGHVTASPCSFTLLNLLVAELKIIKMAH